MLARMITHKTYQKFNEFVFIFCALWIATTNLISKYSLTRNLKYTLALSLFSLNM